MRHSATSRSVTFGVVLAMLVATGAVTRTQRGRGGPPPAAPVTTGTILENPDAFYGEQVSVSAGVDQILSKTAFTVDQRWIAEDGKTIRNLGKSILVIAPDLNGALDPQRYFLMRGEVLKFDPAEIAAKAKGYKIDFAPDVAARFQGKPVLLANSVINDMYKEIGKNIPPMTDEEQALSQIMKRIGPANAALQAGAKDSSADPVKENAVALKQALAETETFWKAKGQTQAAQWAHDALLHAEAIERDVAAGKWDAVKTSTAELTQTCTACHTANRERMEDGTFRIKK